MVTKRRPLLSLAKENLLAQAGHSCALCHQALILEETALDHIIPIARGGSDDWANLQPTHRRCNMEKHTRLPGEPSERERRQAAAATRAAQRAQLRLARAAQQVEMRATRAAQRQRQAAARESARLERAAQRSARLAAQQQRTRVATVVRDVPAATVHDDLLTVREAAARLGVPVRTIQHRVAHGLLPARRAGGWLWLIPAAALTPDQASKLRPGPKPGPAHD